MEIDRKSPQELMAKKLWNIARIVFHMMRKNIAKGMISSRDLHVLLRRGKLATKAIGNLLYHRRHYYSSLTCRSTKITTAFVSPRDYEFSCSNTPLYTKRKTLRPQYNVWSPYDGAIQVSPLRVMTESPDAAAEENNQVDKDAEEFIKRFYMDLKNQKRFAALESPSPLHLWGR